ncbi:MAG: hypothetical protein A2W25_07980 [candidate division Zixibacteria bacterium RBG_16_53_22]|nr:MAG: hypothetical protein A2W25_07980 [candidate division Zixibacteria bacterium RBG_16_53_22]
MMRWLFRWCPVFSSSLLSTLRAVRPDGMALQRLNDRTDISDPSSQPGPPRKANSWRRMIYLPCLILLVTLQSYAQAPDTSITIHGGGTRGPYQLGFHNLVTGSISLLRNGAVVESNAYTVQTADGIINLNEPLGLNDSILVRFQYIPLNLRSQYSIHALSSENKIPAIEPAEPGSFRGFGSDLKVTGSKGFSVQTDDGTAGGLSQSLNLSISGELAPGLRTSANVSDKSNAVTGATRRLNELDKIYVVAESDHFKGIFGDFDIEQRRDPLLGYQRKLTGLNVLYSKHGNTITGAAAFFPGEFRAITINGRDGRLGPYYLTDIGGRQAALVLPGSERVYIDGALQSRGPQNDYEIDYETGTFQFSPSKVIRDETRITIDYEVAREEYSRGFYTASGDGSPVRGLRFFSSLIQEGDNRNSPKSFELTPEARQILEQAGSDRLRAARSGVQFVGPGAGDYDLDSTVTVHYVYAGVNQGSYDVAFSFIGQRLGSYRALGGGIFEYAGQGLADYEPVILIPIPETRRYGSAGADWRSPDSAIAIGGEMAGSLYDRNTLSSHDSRLNDLTFLGSGAYRRNLLGGFIGIKALGRAIGNNAIFPGRIDDVERFRNYDLDSQASPNGERVREIELTGGLTNDRQIMIELGHLTKPGITSRGRQAANAGWRLFSPFDIVSSVERTRGDRTWWKSMNAIRAAFEFAQPSLGLNFERRDGVAGFKYYEYIARIPANYARDISGATEVTVRDEKFLDTGWRDKFMSGALQQRVTFLIAGTGFSGDAALSYYRKDYKDFAGTDTEQKTGWTRLSYSDPSGRGSLTIGERLGSSNERLQAKNYVFIGDGRGEYRLEDGEYIRDPQGDYTLIIEELGEGARISEIGTEIDASVSPLLLLNNTPAIEQKAGRLSVEANLDYSLRKSSDRLIARDFMPWKFTGLENVAFQIGELKMRAYYYPAMRDHRIKYNFSRAFENGSQFANEQNDNISRTDELSWAFPAGKKIDLIITGLLAQTRRSINTLKYTVDRKSLGALANYHFARQWTLSAGPSFERSRQSDIGLRADMPALEFGLARDLEKSGRISTRLIYTRLNANPLDSYVPFQVARGRGNGDNFEAIISARMPVTKNGRFDLSYRHESFAHRPQTNNLRLEFTVLFL